MSDVFILAVFPKECVCVCFHFILPLGKLRPSALLHFVVGELSKNERQFYLKFLIGVLTKLCLYTGEWHVLTVSIEDCHSKGRWFESGRCQSFILQLRQCQAKNSVKRKRRMITRSGSEEHVKQSRKIGSKGTRVRNEKVHERKKMVWILP